MLGEKISNRISARVSTGCIALALMLTPTLSPGQAAETIDFPLHPLAGEQQSLSDYRGRWVIVNYWATWCPPCRKEIPELDMFNENHQKDAVVLGINFEDIALPELKTFVDQQFISYPIFHQSPQRLTPFGRMSGLPTTYVVNPEGVPVAMQSGGITADRLEQFIARYRAEHPTPTPATTTAAVDDAVGKVSGDPAATTPAAPNPTH